MSLSASAPGTSRPASSVADPFANNEPSGNTSIRTGGAPATITANVQPLRASDTAIHWTTDSPLITLGSDSGKSITVSGSNTTNHAEYATVNATAANGFYVTSHINVEPAYIDPPAFTRNPTIAPPAGGKIAVDYALDLGGRNDESLIDWYACDDAQCATRREVAVSRGNQPLRASHPHSGSFRQIC